MKNKKIIYALFFSLCLCGWLKAKDAKRGIMAHLPDDTKPVIKKAPSLIQSAPSSKTKSVPAQKDSKQNKNSLPVMPKPPAINSSINHADLEPVDSTPKAEKYPDLKPEIAAVPTEEEKKDLELAHKKEQEEQLFEFYFEDATLENLVTYMAGAFGVTFLPDDAVAPVMAGGGKLEGHKISFKTNKPLTRDEAWNVFVKLLDLAQLSLVPGANENSYGITSSAATTINREPLPIYFDTDPDKLPGSAIKVRYVYFVKNNSLANVQKVMDSLKSTTAALTSFPDLDALILTDKANNITSLMKIVKEFDLTMPEALSVIKLKKTDATKVAKLYEDLTNKDSGGNSARYLTQKSQPSSLYFSPDARIIPDPRTNYLFLLGPKDSLQKIEDFIKKHIDTELDLPYSPLHTYDLQYAEADNIKSILQSVLGFGQGTDAASYGGVRDGEKYFKPGIEITTEKTGNILIIKAEEEDYKKLKEIIDTLDVPQPQVAIEVLIVDVSAVDTKELGVQLRNKSDGSIIKNVNMQTSGVGGVTTNTGKTSLLGNLISLATGNVNGAGTTMMTIGNTVDGVWGIFRVLRTVTNTKIVNNPFILTTNKFKGHFKFGKTRRVILATVGTSNSFGSVTATLDMSITPQINTSGMITMDIDMQIDDFANESDTDAATLERHITTAAHVKDGEVLVLGGITKNTISRTTYKTPFLGDIPLLGNLFRSKTKAHTRSNLLVFISPRIVKTHTNQAMNVYTQNRVHDMKNLVNQMEDPSSHNDPIQRAFFDTPGSKTDGYSEAFDDFLEKTKKLSNYKKNPFKKSQNKKSNRKRRLAHKKKDEFFEEDKQV